MFSPAGEDDPRGISVTVKKGNEVVASASSERNFAEITDAKKSPITTGPPCLDAPVGDNDKLRGGDLVCDTTCSFSRPEGNPVLNMNGGDGKLSRSVGLSTKQKRVNENMKVMHGIHRDAATWLVSLLGRGKSRPEESHEEGYNLME